MKIENLLELLSLHKGSIVSTASLTTSEINQARASERMYVDDQGLGFVWVPLITKFPEYDYEVAFFEKWYPLEEDLPEHLKKPPISFKPRRFKD